MSEVKFKLAAGTNVGLIRQNNEDNFVVCPNLSTSEWLIPQDGNYAVLGDLGALLVVADGMGGANAGEVASAIAVQTIQDLFKPDELKRVVSDDKAIQKFMVDVVKAADLNILNRSKSDKSSRGMGTTIVMAWILGRRAYVCWCGDSRCYALTRHNGLVQVSKDHSFVQELVDRGELEPEFMHDHPLSNVITRCLGDMEKRARPETRIFELYDGDTILLCSDGLSGMCYDNQIGAILDECHENPMECKNELISAALSNGGHDNVTVALCTVQLENPGDLTVRPGKASMPRVRNPEAEELRSTVPTEIKGRKTRKKEETPVAPVQPVVEQRPVVVEQKPVVAEQPVVMQQPAVENAPVKEAPAETPVEAVAEEKPAAAEETAKKPEGEEKEKETGNAPADAEAKENAPAVAADDKKEGEEKKKDDETEVDNTVKQEKKPAKKSKAGVVLLLIVLLLVAVAACIMFVPQCASVREAIMQMLHKGGAK